jgi:DNA-binding MarR family transcriptional regulator
MNDSLSLANEFRPVLLRLSRLVRRESHELGVTAGQVTLLSAIGDRPDISGRELADQERISAPGMSAHLDRLETAGLIVRTRSADRRRVGVSLSPEGLSEPDRALIEAAIGPLARLIEDAE